MTILDKSILVKLQSKRLWNYEYPVNWPVFRNYILPPLFAVACSFIVKTWFVHNIQMLPLLLYFALVTVFAAYVGLRAGIISAASNIICALAFFIYPTDNVNIQEVIMQFGGLAAGSGIIIFLSYVTPALKIAKLKAKEKHENVSEKSWEGFFTTGNTTRITYACPTTLALLGYNKQELERTDFYKLINQDQAAEFKIQFLKLLATADSTIRVRHQLKTKDDGWIWAEITVKNLLFDKRIKRVIYHLTDVTQKISDELKQEDFVNIASHELKNPITALYGYMYLLNARIKGNDDIKQVTQRMDAQLYKMQSIISTMLDNTRIKAGELSYNFEAFDLIDCINEAVDAITVHTDSHVISCAFESGFRRVNGDCGKIGQVITNLITNAIKYSPQGKCVAITTELEQDHIKVSIKDDGIGIAKDKQQSLFQRFYRVDTLPKKIKGLGLGLFIAAEIIRHHKGTISVKSEEGVGSTFWFTLPIIT